MAIAGGVIRMHLRADGLEKVGFPHKREAKRHARRVSSMLGHRRLQLYRCSVCRMWHSGNRRRAA